MYPYMYLYICVCVCVERERERERERETLLLPEGFENRFFPFKLTDRATEIKNSLCLSYIHHLVLIILKKKSSEISLLVYASNTTK